MNCSRPTVREPESADQLRALWALWHYDGLERGSFWARVRVAIEVAESIRWCDVRMVGFAWFEAGKSVLLTLHLLPDERKAYLLCRWAELVKINLEFGDRDGGSPFSWEGEV